MKILVIDDDKPFRSTLCRFLAGRGHVLETAECGLVGLNLLEKDRVDLVFCDLQMSGMDGFSFLRIVREKFPGLPVITMSGDGNLDNAVAAFREGAFDYLKKPIGIEELAHCLEKLAQISVS